MSPSSPDRLIQQFRFRLGLLYTLKHTLILATIWAFIWGVVVVGLRASFGTQQTLLLWGLVPIPLMLIPANWWARRQLPAPKAIRALLDQRNRKGGMLMASEERALGSWTRQLDVQQSPSPSWNGRRHWCLFILSLFFVGASFLMPQQFMRLGAEPPLEIRREVERLNKQIEVLKEEKILDRERADALEKKLNQLDEDASGRDPVKTLDALDHLEKLAKDAAQQDAQQAGQQNDRLTKAKALAEALKKNADRLSKKKNGEQKEGIDGKTLNDAMKELARLTRNAMKGKDALDEFLDPKLKEQLERELAKGADGKIDPRLLEKLAKALGENQADINRKLLKLRNVKLIDGKMCKECQGGGKIDPDQLLRMLMKGKGGKKNLKQMLAQLQGMPGAGGINRGPGAAPMIFGKRSPDQKKFKEAILPPSRLEDLKKSKILGSSKAQPKVGNDGEIAKAGTLQGANSGGGSANRQIVLPRHRRAVSRYFERTDPRPRD